MVFVTPLFVESYVFACAYCSSVFPPVNYKETLVQKYYRWSLFLAYLAIASSKIQQQQQQQQQKIEKRGDINVCHLLNLGLESLREVRRCASMSVVQLFRLFQTPQMVLGQEGQELVNYSEY